MDVASIIGILIGITAIVGTQLFESSSISAIIQPTAAFIVFGGTLGAVFLNFSLPSIVTAFLDIKKVFIYEQEEIFESVEQIVQIAGLARQDGILAIQEVIPSIDNPFLSRGLQLIIDINNPQLIHNLLTNEINLEEEQGILSARIFEAIGGFAPTFGVVGAVLGLIQVMNNLQDPSYLGHGIATAFVATVYGVGSANLIFLPIAGKLKMRLKEEIIFKEMMLQGIISVQLGENPAIIEEKLLSFLNFSSRKNEFQFGYKASEEINL